MESLTSAAESGAGARAALSRAMDMAPPELAGTAVMDDWRKVRGRSLWQGGEVQKGEGPGARGTVGA